MRIVEEIRSELKKMEKQDVYIFILSLLSRQKSMFDRVACINQWDGINVIADIYDCVKRNVLENVIMNECGWENMNEEMFCSNEYVQLEYSREKRDLERIQKGEYVQDSGSEMLIHI